MADNIDEHTKIVSQCARCGHISGSFCSIYIDPYAKWRSSNTCPMFTGDRGKAQTPQKKQRIGQQRHIKKAKVSKKQETAYAKLSQT